MAGHSKWANTKYRKERADAKRGKIISRIAKEIISAVKLNGSDPKSNPRLRQVLQKAKEANVSNDVIERNIAKASSADQSDFSEMTYELYGHGGVGIIVDILTDNKNRISSEMNIATNKKGGTIASPGSVAFNFDRLGVIRIAKNRFSEERLFNLAIEAGAEDFEVEDEMFVIKTDPKHLSQVKESLIAGEVPIEEDHLEMVPKITVDCDEEAAKANLALIEWLEALDDVDAVYHNMA